MNGMVERQMRTAIFEIGCFWYSAWVDAGQPVLKNLKKTEPMPDEKQEDVNIEKKYQKGRIIGREI
jgi:hypothetical protein